MKDRGLLKKSEKCRAANEINYGKTKQGRFEKSIKTGLVHPDGRPMEISDGGRGNGRFAVPAVPFGDSAGLHGAADHRVGEQCDQEDGADDCVQLPAGAAQAVDYAALSCQVDRFERVRHP